MLYSHPSKVNEMALGFDVSGGTPRICVVFPGALGDFLCFLPTLRLLSAHAPVDLFARSEFADLVPPAVKVCSSERHEIAELFVPGAAPTKRLCDFFRGYDSVYSWLGSQDREFVQSLQIVSQGRARVFAFRPTTGGIVHQADYYLSCIRGKGQGSAIPVIAPKPEMMAWSESYWAQHSLHGKPVLTLAPGSGSKEKNWPVNSYGAVAEWWASQTQGAVVVIAGPVEAERGGLEPLLDHTVAAIDLNLGQVAALLKRSALYLGNDSGITHLAAAVGVRTVALFGPSDARRWGPRGERVTVLSRNVECSPCDLPVMKNCLHRKCLTEFAVEKVIAELSNLPEMASLTRLGPGIRV